MGEFDDYWARAYRGDSGVPHSDPQRLVLLSLGLHSWQDMTMMLDQKRWKKILEKKQQQA
ncbi:hypothetical protein E2562_030035 [Oryza meyeriana var. granulata]|uniref:Uncharacterized protein n=1 Tax=Oryza meyeriana var. granulata TaxID=110450 RepID=A0A6G1ECW9_9ORYZ|nr:hypothetical protein E2562_030035 [Oryza meyeriana var. granulata]